ncbi:MAG: isoprenyl transferase [Clostridia bacterium]|nr:isoprenyl transferase [Clostridia bacterium]
MNNYKDENYIKSSGIDFVLPKHVGIIMDGNGRWAKKRLLPRNMGHKEGVKRLRAISRVTGKLGIDYLTVYAFSTENWKRSEEEVAGLMKLLLEGFNTVSEELSENHVKIRCIGERDRLSDEVVNAIDNVQSLTEKNDGLTLNIAFNYGARRELVHAVKSVSEDILNGKLSVSDIDEDLIADRLYTGGQQDPDVIIRTGGEMRLSNFMLYQAAYSEFISTDVLWPDFSDEKYIEALREFSMRTRRFGGVKE